jgi:hypothetical protein
VNADRFSRAAVRAVVVSLAGLLFAAAPPAAGQSINLQFNFGRKAARADPSTEMARALARQVEEVDRRFAQDRRALAAVAGPEGERAYVHEEVTGLIARTEEDLDRAIERVGESDLDALRSWSAEEFRRLRQGLEVPAQRAAAAPLSGHGPRAVAVIARLGDPPVPVAPLVAAASRQATVPAEESDRLLDRVGEVVGRILLLAAHDDLEVDLWVGSTPAPRAKFSFWPQGKLQGSAAPPAIIRTNAKRDRVLRGLYSYRASLADGAVTASLTYPTAAGAAAEMTSERLDLVNGSSFFCCRFDEQYCHHVADAEACRP